MSAVFAVSVDEINDRIAELIEIGSIGTTCDDDVLYEMASRYLAGEVKRRERSSVRNVEARQKIKSETRVKLVARIAETVQAHTEHVVAGWSEKLLAETFSTLDGCEVSYRDATIEQHESMAAWCENQSASLIETASIHRAAIRDIRAAGALTLGGVVDALIA